MEIMNQAYKLHGLFTKTGDATTLHSLLLLPLHHPATLSYVRSFFLHYHASFPSSSSTFAWNTIIRAHSSLSPSHALCFFAHMRFLSVPPDLYTFPLLLKACSSSSSSSSSGLVVGLSAHSLAIKLGFASDIYVQNTLIGFYAAGGRARRALSVFEEMPRRDSVSWSAIISGLAANGWEDLALAAFRCMQASREAPPPDEVTMVGVVSAIAGLGALDLGLWVHAYIVRRGFRLTVALGTALVDMFAACGSIDRAAWVFDGMPDTSVKAWTALINGYAAHGRSDDAVRAFHRMTSAGLKPDQVAFVGVLTACSHGGLLVEGLRLFASIAETYGMEPVVDHYGCVVDLLGRSGLLEEAHEFAKRMPMRPNSVIWRTLLGACVSHGYVELAEQVRRTIAEMEEPPHDGDDVLLSNAYGGIQRWVEKDEVRRLMRDEGIEKRPGCSLLGR